MLPKARDEAGRWKCGSNVWDKLTGGEHFHTTDLCCEREDHNETKRELEKWQSLAAQYSAGREHNANVAEMWRSVAAEFRGAVYYQFGNLPMAWTERVSKSMAAYEEAVK